MLSYLNELTPPHTQGNDSSSKDLKSKSFFKSRFSVFGKNLKKFIFSIEHIFVCLIAAANAAYCLMAVILHGMQLKRLTYEVLQNFIMSFMDKTPFRKLFDKTYSNNVKEQFGLLNSWVV